ncbi:hypothetical protein WN944_025843 [Citrus x changshan-huyou]|uniref:Uncharacterized protein n=1 Tax=Citrus x changshan-huyou TaxID=2935761 RepID=A0AAP0LRZ0_9ROSI
MIKFKPVRQFHHYICNPNTLKEYFLIKMSTISSNLMIGKAIPLRPIKKTLTRPPLIILSFSSAATSPHKKMNLMSLENGKKQTHLSGYKFLAKEETAGPAEFPGKTPQEFPSETPNYEPDPIPTEIPKIPEIEIDPTIPPEITVVPDPKIDIPLPPNNPSPPQPDTQPPDPSPDILPPPSTPPNIEPSPIVPPDIQRPGGPPFAPVVSLDSAVL